MTDEGVSLQEERNEFIDDSLVVRLSESDHEELDEYTCPSYSIGLYSLKFIKPYGQRVPHFQKKCGWRKVMMEMARCGSKIQR